MRVLFVEDEMFLATSMIKQLTKHNIHVTHVYDGEEALDLILYDNFDIVILDIMLPGIDGLEIIKKVRSSNSENKNIIIILTSAKGEVEDKVYGLEIGADDYLAKPYEFIELLARIKTNLRRVGTTIIDDNVSYENIILDRNSLLVSTDANELKLTLKEFDLLEYLINSIPNTISKEQIIAKVWGYDSEALPNHVEVYISYLRKKLKLLGANIEIKTVRGVGYKLEKINV